MRRRWPVAASVGGGRALAGAGLACPAMPRAVPAEIVDFLAPSPDEVEDLALGLRERVLTVGRCPPVVAGVNARRRVVWSGIAEGMGPGSGHVQGDREERGGGQ
jgi:hypothetical protein